MNKKYLEVAKILAQINLLKKKRTNILDDAIREMREEGYTFEQIAAFLKVSKITAIDAERQPQKGKEAG